MIKLRDCKAIANPQYDVDQLELYIDIITYTDNKQLNTMYNKLKGKNTIQLQNKKRENDYCIIHTSTKKSNTIQISYFDSNGAYADKERLTIKDALKEIFKDYTIKEVA